MIRSMTAYGKGIAEDSSVRFAVEIQSINRKHFDLNINLPKELSGYEPEVREWLKGMISRGQVSLRVTFSAHSSVLSKLVINWGAIEQYQNAIQQLNTFLKTEEDSKLLLRFLLGQPSIFTQEPVQDNDRIRDLLKEAVLLALANFIKMKEEEGKAIIQDFESRLHLMSTLLSQIQLIADQTPSKYREKLLKRLEEVNGQIEITDQRILTEIALFAERVDITEEITRFYSHLSQFRIMMSSPEPVGKNLEFLLQELFREINTMNSKLSDLKGIQLCLQIKGELEKIREQVQNIE